MVYYIALTFLVPLLLAGLKIRQTIISKKCSVVAKDVHLSQCVFIVLLGDIC